MKTISLEKRTDIERLINEGLTVKKIAEKLQMCPSSIYRELKKCKGSYSAEEADKNTCKGYKPIDFSIIGKKFGRLTIVEYMNQKVNHRTFWKAMCDCGTTTYISRKVLGEYCSADRELSCGCIAKESRGILGQVPIEEAALRKFQDLIVYRQIEDRCWIYTGYRQNGQIPRTSWKDIAMSVRKCMYLIINGTTYEPNPTYANCRNRFCFNPEHITLGRPPQRNWYFN